MLTTILTLLMATLTVQVDPGVDGLVLVLEDASGEAIRRLPASSAGAYVFDDVPDGAYTLRAEVGGATALSIPGIELPQTTEVDVRLPDDLLAAAPVSPTNAGAGRNPNIQVNLIDNQARNESLERQGAPVSPIEEFSAGL